MSIPSKSSPIHQQKWYSNPMLTAPNHYTIDSHKLPATIEQAIKLALDAQKAR